jgi:diaminohydroxyphosphoribosylaminopyrimidine deaminase / 5-amino-6-(5-phosphoribosylamino)uracil reductase
MAPLDRSRLEEALAEAEASIGLTEPNPRVGCVIGREDGRVFGRGGTQQAGGPHAEVMALRDAAANGHDVRGATAWVTLEPCAHHGRTPPCCDALIAAGIGRVVAALEDPFPQVAGRGTARLRANGIRVDAVEADLSAAAWDLNIGFFSRTLRQRPWLRLKSAASLDGRTALPDGRSQWITGPAARADGHAWRHRASAVLSGIGTVLADDPRLDVREVPAKHQPLRVIVDSALRTPAAARLLAPPGAVLIVHAEGAGSAAAAQALRDRGAELLALPRAAGGVGIDLQALLAELARRGVNELHAEAGPTLSGALLQAGLVDELLLYVAPTLIGPGRAIADWPQLPTLDERVALAWHDSAPVGNDLRLRLRSAAGVAFAAAWRAPTTA